MFLELSLLIECQLWAERAIGRLGSQFKNSRREMEICASLPFALTYIEGNSDRVRVAFSRALDVTITQGDLAYELRLLSGLFAARSKKITLKTRDPDDVALAEALLGATNHVLGNHLVAQQHFESSLSHSTTDSRFRAGLHLFNYTSFSLAGMARSLLYKGLIDQSKVFARLAIEEAEKSGRPATLCLSREPELLFFWPQRTSESRQSTSHKCLIFRRPTPYCFIVLQPPAWKVSVWRFKAISKRGFRY